MKIYFKSDGGFGYFPGLNEQFEINSEDLKTEEEKYLDHIINKIDLNKSSSQQIETQKGADIKKYTITVKTKSQEFILYLSDTEKDFNLKNLLDFLKKKKKESR